MFCIPKILKNESNSQLIELCSISRFCCFVSQRYWKMKAIHNRFFRSSFFFRVVLYPKDTEKWKQFTTVVYISAEEGLLFCIPKILKNESNSQQYLSHRFSFYRCFVSQRYWKMKAIHNMTIDDLKKLPVVLYPKDTEKWKQFTTIHGKGYIFLRLFCIPKILKNESNSQRADGEFQSQDGCFVSQRYWKMKAIHNKKFIFLQCQEVVLYPKDTEKWKQFTTYLITLSYRIKLFCIPKILKNESNSQQAHLCLRGL